MNDYRLIIYDKTRKTVEARNIVHENCIFVDASIFRGLGRLAMIFFDRNGKAFPKTIRIDVNDINEAEKQAVEWAIADYPGFQIYSDSFLAVREFRSQCQIDWIPRRFNRAHPYTRIAEGRDDELWTVRHNTPIQQDRSEDDNDESTEKFVNDGLTPQDIARLVNMAEISFEN